MDTEIGKATPNQPRSAIDVHRLMLRQSLPKEPLWPMYKKLRRHIRRELGYPDVPVDEVDIDRYLAATGEGILETLRNLIAEDLSSRSCAGDVGVSGENEHG